LVFAKLNKIIEKRITTFLFVHARYSAPDDSQRVRYPIEEQKLL
jgi:hypothetical protein